MAAAAKLNVRSVPLQSVSPIDASNALDGGALLSQAGSPDHGIVNAVELLFVRVTSY